MAKVYDTATDLITFARSSSGTALRRVGYGDELLTNGDFATGDLTGWASQSGASVFTVSSGQLTISRSAVDPGYVYQVISTSSGGVYAVTFDIIDDGPIDLRVGTSPAGLQIMSSGIATSSGTYTHYFVATGATTHVSFVNTSYSVDATIDNISVKEVIFDRPSDDLVLFDHPDDIPRIEYDGSDGSLKGLLIEEQRTNLVTYSEDLTAWHTFSGETSVTLSSDTIYGVSAYEVTGSTGGFGLGRLSPNGATSINLTSDGVLTFWAKKITAGTTLQYLWNGSVIIFDSQVPNDGQWHKVEITLAAANSALQLLRGFTSGTVALAMPQLEQGSFATSYIPTSGSQSTRSPDIASIPVSAFGYNQTAGTVVVDFDTVGGADIGDDHYVLSGGNTNSRWAYHNTADILKIYDGANAPYIMINQDDLPVKHKFAVASDASSVSTASGGSVTAANVTSTGNLPALTTAFVLGSSHTDAYQLNGHIKSLKYYPRRLTDAQLQELTS